MRTKKTFLFLLTFLAMLGIGAMLSNIQSQKANQLLEAYGLSNNTRYFKLQNNQNVSTFLQYLEKQFPHNKIQLHLSSNRQDNQTLVWSNHDVLALPTESGRYFTSDDFKGQVSFGVLGHNAHVKKLEVQGNEYVALNRQYYTVIGVLKHYRQMEQNGYYLTTGPKQPTARFKLKNYVVVMDSSTKVIRKVTKHYGVKVKTPRFVKSHQSRQFSIIKEILLILLFLFIAASINIILAYLDWQTVNKTLLSGELLQNWLVNHGIRLILIESLLGIAAYFFLCWRAFYSNRQQLVILLAVSWLLIALTYSYCIFYYLRKDKINA